MNDSTGYFSNYRAKTGTFRIVGIFLVIYLVSQVIIGSILHALGGKEFLIAQTTFSRETYLALVNQWQSAGLMDHYRQHFFLDFIHPVWYSILLSAMLAKGMNLNDVSPRWNWLLAIPFVAGSMDLTENVFHVIFLSDLQNIADWMIVVSAAAANTKWALAGACLLSALILFAAGGIRQVRRVA